MDFFNSRSLSCSSAFLRSLVFLMALLAVTTARAGNFVIDSMTADNFQIIDHNAVTGDDDGGIAVSSSQIFYDGDSGTGRFSITDLSGGTNIGTRLHAMVSDLASSQVYVLGVNATTPLTEGSSGPVTHLLGVNGATGALTGGAIALSAPVTTPSGTGIFAGHERVVLWDGTDAINIDLPSGTVTNLGSVSLTSPQVSEVSRFWGVAEYDGVDVRLVYVQSGGVNIQRTNVSTGTTTTLANFPSGLSDMAAFTVSLANDRWYFHHEGSSGTFGGSVETLGFADATFTSSIAPPAESVPVPTMSVYALMLTSLSLLLVATRRLRSSARRR